MRWFRKNKSENTAGRGPVRHLRERKFDDRDIPPQAQIDKEATSPRVWQNAVWLYLSNLRPDTGQPWSGLPKEQAAINTYEQAIMACQADAVEMSSPEDEAAAALSAESDLLADNAIDEIERAEQLLDDLLPNTTGGMSTSREVLQEHRMDEELAAERAGAGDTRHLHRSVEPVWIGIAASVLALVDVLLLWKPILGLGSLQSGGMLFKWVIAVGGSVFVAWFIDRSVWKYRTAERDVTDRRGVLLDYRRAMQHQRRRPHHPVPELTELTAAGHRMSTAYGWLVLAATLTGIVSGVRIAILSRHSAMPVWQAALFGALLAVMLGGAVVMLGYWSCRGNGLGDRLGLGAKIVAGIDAARRRSVGIVESLREPAREAKSGAAATATRAVEIRNVVAGQYREALLLCWGWAGFDRALMSRPVAVDRQIPIAERALAIRESVVTKLSRVDRWLATSSPVVIQVGAKHPAAMPVGAAVAPVSQQPDVPEPYQRLPELPDEPTTQPLWLVAGAVTAALAAVIAAVLTGSPIPPG